MGANVIGKRPLPTAEMVTDQRIPGEPRISSDGSLVAFTVSPISRTREHPESSIWLAPVDGSSPPRRLTTGETNDNTPRFTPDGRALYFLSDRTERGKAQLQRIPLDGGEAEALTNHRPQIEHFEPLPDGETIALLAKDPPTDEDERRVRERDDARVHGERWPYTRLRLLDLETCEIRTVEDLGERHVAEIAPDPSGSRLALLTWPTPELDNWGRQNNLWMVDLLAGKARHLRTLESGGEGLAWNGDRLFFLGSVEVGAESAAVFRLRADAAEEGPRMLTRDLVACPEELCQIDGTGPLVTVAEGLDTTIKQLDPESGEFVRLSHHPGGLAGLNASADGHAVAALRSTAQTPTETWAGPPGGPLVRLTDTRPELRDVTWGQQERLSWTAEDGLGLDGLLILPPGRTREDGPLPLVTLVHGGPYARYPDSFHLHWCLSGQWLATAGYAVLLPNPRGGQGHGHDFASRVNGAVGPADYGDVETGIDGLVSSGVADPDRLGIGGWSHGGFMTVWAVGQTDRFRAAVMGAGISDWGSLMAEHDLWHHTARECGHTGWEGPGPHRHDELSPASYVHRMRTPTLILHGEKDERVPVGQAHYFARGLREYGVPHELVTYPREGHHVMERNHQIDLLNRSLGWFDRWLRPEPHDRL